MHLCAPGAVAGWLSPRALYGIPGLLVVEQMHAVLVTSFSGFLGLFSQVTLIILGSHSCSGCCCATWP